MGINSGRGALVHFQHGDVAVGDPAQQITAADKGGGDARGDVGPGAVAHYALTGGLQNVGEHIAHGGLAVGAGHGDHGGRLGHIVQEIRTQLQRQTARKVRAVVMGDLQRGNRQLGHPQREQKA